MTRDRGRTGCARPSAFGARHRAGRRCLAVRDDGPRRCPEHRRVLARSEPVMSARTVPLRVDAGRHLSLAHPLASPGRAADRQRLHRRHRWHSGNGAPGRGAAGVRCGVRALAGRDRSRASQGVVGRDCLARAWGDRCTRSRDHEPSAVRRIHAGAVEARRGLARLDRRRERYRLRTRGEGSGFARSVLSRAPRDRKRCPRAQISPSRDGRIHQR